MIKVILAFGTRPEAVKLAPLYKELNRRSDRIRLVCCVTGQHRDLLQPFMEFFRMKADHDLDIAKDDQGLSHITSSVLMGMESVLNQEKPDIVIVQGDTSSAFAAALAAYYIRIPIGHVEAGLRSYDRFQPFPEEINRTFISHIADLNFCPTMRAADNLLQERVPETSVFVTGNTVIDALLYTVRRLETESCPELEMGDIPPGRLILVTGHRRENFGDGLKNLSLALLDLVNKYNDVSIVYCIHPNPNVRIGVEKLLGAHERMIVIPPPGYLRFVSLMKRAFFIITDSGGIQEEAPSLRKPVLVARNVTERPEAVEAGAARIVGTDREMILHEASRLLDEPDHYASMLLTENPFGDGHAAERIADLIEDFVSKR